MQPIDISPYRIYEVTDTWDDEYGDPCEFLRDNMPVYDIDVERVAQERSNLHKRPMTNYQKVFDEFVNINMDMNSSITSIENE